jgi:hypothetical protein
MSRAKPNRGPSLQQTQIRRVFNLLKAGCRTSTDIASATDNVINIACASAYLTLLERRGKIRRIGGLVKYKPYSRGSIQWKPIQS